MLKIKILLTVATIFLGGGVASAAATGHVPEPVKNVLGASDSGTATTTVRDDAYQDDNNAAHDQYGVSSVATDRSAVGTKTLPNGKTVENHGIAVSQAAHELNGGRPDEQNGDVHGSTAVSKPDEQNVEMQGGTTESKDQGSGNSQQTPAGGDGHHGR